MLHPVGPLSAAAYWRRRLLVLGCAGGVLGGGWLGVSAATGGSEPVPAAAAPSGDAPRATPGLEQVIPSLAAVAVPTVAPSPAAPATTSAPASSVPPAPTPGGPCSDDMIDVAVRPDPASAAVGSKPTFVLAATNVSPVACVRAVDASLQEIVLVDSAGDRVWGSNDCYPETATEQRTLQPGETAAFPVVWSGKTSAPGCTAERSAPPAGTYVLRGRLDTDVSPDAPFTLT